MDAAKPRALPQEACLVFVSCQQQSVSLAVFGQTLYFKMVVKFKKGSISDIVNTSSQELKKKKKQKKNVQESLDETEIAEIKAEPVEPTEGKPVASGKKRKVSSSDNDNAENAPVAEPKGKKKQKGQKNKSTNEAKTAQPKVDKLEKDDAQELPVDEGESNEAKLEKLSRTLFIGNLAANFSLKVLCDFSV